MRLSDDWNRRMACRPAPALYKIVGFPRNSILLHQHERASIDVIEPSSLAVQSILETLPDGSELWLRTRLRLFQQVRIEPADELLKIFVRFPDDAPSGPTMSFPRPHDQLDFLDPDGLRTFNKTL